MRHIDLEYLEGEIEATWHTRASRAKDKIKETSEADRARTLNQHQKIWKDLKDALRRASHNKCWYCESIEERADNAVDHFRPKNRVAEAIDPRHSGYWWLAFDWRNYRFSCTFCNSYRLSDKSAGGKHDHFPLKLEEKRAKTPEDRLEDEQPLLLDPTILKDVMEITFERDGRAVPRRMKGKKSFQYERAFQTIKIYHLNAPQIVERRAKLMRTIRRYLKEADIFFEREETDALLAFNHIITNIHKACRPDAEYSRAVWTTVGSLRATYRSADELFNYAPL